MAETHTLAEVRGELLAFSSYCDTVARDSIGLLRDSWQERAEWAKHLSEVLAQLDAAGTRSAKP